MAISGCEKRYLLQVGSFLMRTTSDGGTLSPSTSTSPRCNLSSAVDGLNDIM